MAANDLRIQDIKDTTVKTNRTNTKKHRVMRNDNSTRVLGAVVLGAAIGAGLALLFAPQKGTELRGVIADKTGEWADLLKDKFDHLTIWSKKQADSAKEQLS